MAKKKKSKLLNPDEKHELLQQVIKNISTKKEMTVGSNAVLRKIEKGLIDAVLLVSRNASSAFNQAISLRCRNAGVLVWQIDSFNDLHLDIKTACCGVNFRSLFTEEEYLKLEANIDSAKNSLKSNLQKKCSNSSLEKNSNLNSGCIMPASEDDHDINILDVSEKKVNFYHSKHSTTKQAYIGKAEAFISLNEYASAENDFLDYM